MDRRGEPEQVDSHLRDGINTVLAHYNQHKQYIIPLEECVYVCLFFITRYVNTLVAPVGYT